MISAMVPENRFPTSEFFQALRTKLTWLLIWYFSFLIHGIPVSHSENLQRSLSSNPGTERSCAGFISNSELEGVEGVEVWRGANAWEKKGCLLNIVFHLQAM